MFRPTNITNQTKFPVSTQPYKAQISGFVDKQILAWMAKTHFIPSTSSQHKLAPLFVFWKKNSKLSQKLIKTNFQKHFGRSGANWARSKVSTRFMLECSFWSHCTPATVFTLHFFHPIHTKTTVCFTQVALKPTILIITTENTEINLFLVQQQLLSHIHKKIGFFTWNQHVGGLIEWLLAWSLPVHVVWICVLFERMAQYMQFFVECWIWRLFHLETAILSSLFSHSSIPVFRDGNDRFIAVTLTVMGKVLFKIVTLFLTNKLTQSIYPRYGCWLSITRSQTNKNKNLHLIFVCFAFPLLSQQKKLYSSSLLMKLSWHQETAIEFLCSVTPPSQYFFSCFPSTLNKASVGLNNHSILLTFRKVKKQERKSICKKEKTEKNKKTKQKCLSFSSALSLLFCVFGLAWIRLYITPKTKQKRSQITKKHKHKSVNPKQATTKTITQNQHGTQSWQNNLLLNSM